MIPIIKASILNAIRDRKNHLFMIFFPVFLILLLGSILSSYFNQMEKQVVLEEIVIYYLDEGSDKTKEVLNIFKDIELNDEENSSITFKEIYDIEDGKKEVRVNRKIFLHLKGDNIDFYSNSQSLVQPSFVYGVLNGISNRFNAIMEVYSLNPMKVEELVEVDNSKNYIKEESITLEEVPSAMDYYGVAEIGLMIFYFIMIPISVIKDQRKYSIKDRISLSGISTSKYYLSSFIGFFLYSFGTLMITYLISNFILKVNYGDNLFILPLATIPFLIIVIGIGIIIPMIFKEEEISAVLIQSIIIPVLTFLGGGYIALYGDLGGVFNFITSISPLRWFNMSIFRYVYSGDSSTLIRWLQIGLFSLIVIILLIYIIGERSDRINE